MGKNSISKGGQLMRYYLEKLLTNTQGQDGSSISVYEDEDPRKALDKARVGYHQILTLYHNADDVLFAVVKIQNEYGVEVITEIVDHKPQPEPEPEPEPDPEES